MNRFVIATCLAWAWAAPASAHADGPLGEVAARGWAITDAVLDRHIAPPARQQMILAGVRAMALSAQVAAPPDLSRRVSELAGPDRLAALLAETLAGPKLSDEARPITPRRSPGGEETSPGDAFLEGLLAAVPGGAELMAEKDRKVHESFQANLYVGIQIKLGVDGATKQPVFMEIFEGGPADLAGAKAGDLIEFVDGEATRGMPIRQVVDRLRGPEGTDVLVRFSRPSTRESFTKPMTRGRLPRPTILGLRTLPGKRQVVRFDGPEPIGYLKLTEISGSTPQELRAFAAQLESEGVKALVLDLRGVESANVHESVLLADALLDGGVIGRVQSVQAEKTFEAQPDALFRGWPLAVVVDGCRQPAVAWLADALEDNHRATILGETALVRDPTIQEAVALPGGEWSVQMATSRLLRGNGSRLSHSSPEEIARNFREPPVVPGSVQEAVRPARPGMDLLLQARRVLGGALGTSS